MSKELWVCQVGQADPTETPMMVDFDGYGWSIVHGWEGYETFIESYLG